MVKRWLRPLSTRSLLKAIDQDRFAYLQRKHCDPRRLRRPHGYLDARRYLDVKRFLEVGKRDVQELGLRRVVGKRRRLRILDLGAGAGYFGFICRHLGHQCTNLDDGGDFLLSEIQEVLGLESDRVVHRILPHHELPEFSERFDLITGLSVDFHRRDGNGVWNAGEWDFFLSNVKRLLKPGGRLHLRLNPDHLRTYYDDQVVACFVRHGFRLDASRLTLELSKPTTDEAGNSLRSGLAIPNPGA